MLISISTLLFVGMALVPPPPGPQKPQDEPDYQAERRRAIELFNKDQHMEALPIFADLAKKNPKDHAVLVGLATCMVSEASTLEDEKAAAEERVRARALLLKAKELGSTSTLMENLLQKIPADGVINYSNSPADQAMRAGEAAFARRDFDQAIQHYSKALELDPRRYAAALFIGDTYFTEKDFAQAAVWYERAIELGPDQETAYRYYADMLTKQGDMAKARTMAIRAVIAEPYNPITWRGLTQWTQANHLQLARVHVDTPNSVKQTADKNITINVDPTQSKEVMGVWMSYSLARAAWSADKFKQHFPQEKEYRHSLAEESDALTSAATVWKELNEADKKPASALPSDPNLLTLIKLQRAGMIDPYVLLNAADQGIAQDYAAYREKNRGKLEEYLGTFIVPPATVK